MATFVLKVTNQQVSICWLLVAPTKRTPGHEGKPIHHQQRRLRPSIHKCNECNYTQQPPLERFGNQIYIAACFFREQDLH